MYGCYYGNKHREQGEKLCAANYRAVTGFDQAHVTFVYISSAFAVVGYRLNLYIFCLF